MSAQTAVVYFKNSLSSYDAEASNEFSSVGLDASGNYAIVTDANYIQSADKITTAIEALDDAIHQISVDYTTIEDMDARITNLVNGAPPETLDTLKRIADSLGNDANFAANLVTSITSRRDAAKAAELVIRTDLSSESVRATAAENAISANILTEQGRAEAAEAILTADLASKVSASSAQDIVIATAYNAMVSDRITALSELNTAKSTDITSRDDAATAALASEVSRAEAAELVLRTDLATEVSRAEAAELVLRTGLATEVSRAEAAELVLRTDLATEVSRAEAAEDALSTRITDVETNYIKMDGSVAMTGNLNMANHRIIGVGAPSDPTDMVNKQYVDLGISNIGNPFEYIDVITIVAGTPYVMSSLGTVEKPIETGDAYKIAGVPGKITTPTGDLDVKVGDFVVFNGSTWDIFNNSDILVQPTEDRIAVSGNSFGEYTLNIDADYAGQASIITVGTISTGEYRGDVIATAYGGLGQFSFLQGDLLLGNASSGLDVLHIGVAGTMLKHSSGTADWVPQDTANFTLTSGVTSALVDGISTTNELGLTTSSTVQEAIDGLYDAIQKRKYVQFIGPVNSANYESVQSSLLNGKVHFINPSGNRSVMLPATADKENAVIRIVNNADPIIASLESGADDNDILVKYNDGSSDVEVAYIAPKDTMVFIYNSAQSPVWMAAIGI